MGNWLTHERLLFPKAAVQAPIKWKLRLSAFGQKQTVNAGVSYETEIIDVRGRQAVRR